MSGLQIAPSILAADFLNLGSEIESLLAGGADVLHLDVMDGHFVPNISFGIPVVQAVKKLNQPLPLDVHLMVSRPDDWVKPFAEAGANWISFHWEAATHAHRTIGSIKELGLKAGIAINPSTSVNELEEVLPNLDFVCLMSVNPGFGGQSFIESSVKKVAKLKALITKHNLSTKIEVDGGVSLQNCIDLKNAGADILVVGNSLFKSENKSQTIAELRGN